MWFRTVDAWQLPAAEHSEGDTVARSSQVHHALKRMFQRNFGCMEGERRKKRKKKRESDLHVGSSLFEELIIEVQSGPATIQLLKI